MSIFYHSFATEQEKNHHCISHWLLKPYLCPSCEYTAYAKVDLNDHILRTHKQSTPNPPPAGPLVAKLLEISDARHKREALVRETPPVPAVLPEPKEVRDPLAVDSSSTPNDSSSTLTCNEGRPKEEEEGALSDSDLIIVTKTDENVPSEGDVFCCDHCPFMAHSELEVLDHLEDNHAHFSSSFHKVNRTACERLEEHVGCSYCLEKGSEVKVRQHQMEKHPGYPYHVSG